MGFVDTAAQKATEIGLEIKDKGKEVVDKVKLSASLSKEKRDLKKTYVEIGMKYAEEHEGEAEGEMGMLLQAVADAKKRIEELEEKINEA